MKWPGSIGRSSIWGILQNRLAFGPHSFNDEQGMEGSLDVSRSAGKGANAAHQHDSQLCTIAPQLRAARDTREPSAEGESRAPRNRSWTARAHRAHLGGDRGAEWADRGGGEGARRPGREE